MYIKSYRFILLHIQLPDPQLILGQSRKVPLVSVSLGPLQLCWGRQLGTGSIIMVAAVAVWILVVAPQTIIYWLFFRMIHTLYLLLAYQNTSLVKKLRQMLF